MFWCLKKFGKSFMNGIKAGQHCRERRFCRVFLTEILMWRFTVYPLSLNLIDSRDESQSVIWLSRKASVSELFQRVCALRGVEQDKVHIWDYFNKRKHAQLFASNKNLEEYYFGAS